jgi:hypothetical protein
MSRNWVITYDGQQVLAACVKVLFWYLFEDNKEYNKNSHNTQFLHDTDADLLCYARYPSKGMFESAHEYQLHWHTSSKPPALVKLVLIFSASESLLSGLADLCCTSFWWQERQTRHSLLSSNGSGYFWFEHFPHTTCAHSGNIFNNFQSTTKGRS